MRPQTTASGLLPAGKASTATRIIYFQSRLRFCPTDETNSERSYIQYASYYSNYWRINIQQAPFRRRVIESKPGQTLVFDPDGLKVVCAPARFWERGAHCFVGRRFSFGSMDVPFILDVRLVDAPAGVTQEKGHTGFRIHLHSAVLASIFLARRIQPPLSLVDREAEFCVPTN